MTSSNDAGWRHIRVESAVFSIHLEKHGAWAQKWDNTDHLLLELKNISANRSELSPWMFKALFERLFTSYRELADWLWEDPDTGLSKKTVLDYVYADPALKVCDALAQTCKHRVRTTDPKYDPLTAWLSEVGSCGAYAIVSWESQGGSVQGERDALELAEQVADAWWHFLLRVGLVPDDSEP